MKVLDSSLTCYKIGVSNWVREFLTDDEFIPEGLQHSGNVYDRIGHWPISYPNSGDGGCWRWWVVVAAMVDSDGDDGDGGGGDVE